MNGKTTHTFDAKAFYAHLNQARFDANMTWTKVAQEVGATVSTFARMAKGATPSAHVLVSLVRWMETEGDSLTAFIKKAS